MATKACGDCYGLSIDSRSLVAWSCLFATVVCCVLYSRPVFSKPVPVWAAFTQDNSDLPSDSVLSLALGADAALWVGTGYGLGWLDKDGHWQTYTQASTQGGLPDDDVRALALGADGALWVGTFDGGLGRRDKDGHWQSYTQANTQGGLPFDRVLALALGADGALWLSTTWSHIVSMTPATAVATGPIWLR
jgi:ligand-binding sensor domain-containing protein